MRVSSGRLLSTTVGSVLLVLGLAAVLQRATGRDTLSAGAFFAGLGLALVVGAFLRPHPKGTTYGSADD